MTRPTVISLFSGGLGLDLGLEQAGFEIRVAVECNRYAVETIRLNRPGIPIIEKRIEDTPTEEILSSACLKIGEATVVTAGPSCQAFSTAGRRGSIGDPRGTLFREFLRVVREAKPERHTHISLAGLEIVCVAHPTVAEIGVLYWSTSAQRVWHALRHASQVFRLSFFCVTDFGQWCCDQVLIKRRAKGEPSGIRIARSRPLYSVEP